jgi:hypothetical protein
LAASGKYHGESIIPIVHLHYPRKPQIDVITRLL